MKHKQGGHNMQVPFWGPHITCEKVSYKDLPFKIPEEYQNDLNDDGVEYVKMINYKFTDSENSTKSTLENDRDQTKLQEFLRTPKTIENIDYFLVYLDNNFYLNYIELRDDYSRPTWQPNMIPEVEKKLQELFLTNKVWTSAVEKITKYMSELTEDAKQSEDGILLYLQDKYKNENSNTTSKTLNVLDYVFRNEDILRQAYTKYNNKTGGRSKSSMVGGKPLVRKSLDKCTIEELKVRARKRGIKITGLKKAEIIAKLRK